MLRLPRNLHFKKQVKILITMEGRFGHDPRPFRNRRSAELALPGSEPPFVSLCIEKHSISCVRYLSNTHFVLRLPRNRHFEVHKVLCLPRNRHFEVHQVLCLPRNLHFKKQAKILITMEGRFDHDPSMTRAHRSAELALPGSEPPFVSLCSSLCIN